MTACSFPTLRYEQAMFPISSNVKETPVKTISFRRTARLALTLFALLSSTAHAQDFTFKQSFGGPGSGNGQFTDPYFLAFDAGNNLYASDFLNNRVEEFTHSGSFLRTIGGGQLSRPLGVTLDAGGNIYIGDYGNSRIVEYNSAGSLIRTVASGVSLPYGLQFDPSANLWVQENHSNIVEFDTSGNVVKTVGTPGSGPGQIRDAGGIAFDANGNLYDADSANNRINEFNSAGGFVRTIGSGGFTDVRVDGSGNIFGADFNSNRVVEYDASGAFVQNIGVGQLSSPSGLAFDNNGNIFVANYGTSNIVEFDLVSTPEPSALAAFGIGACLLGLRRRKQRR